MVDIVIVNWNSNEYLLKCVQSIIRDNNEQYVNKIIIIDNNSSDYSLSLIPKHPKIIIIQNKQNQGFSRACNQGFELCKASYTLLLNPDAQLMNNTLQECIYCMEQINAFDVLGVTLLNDEGKITCSCSRFPSPIRYFYDASGLSKVAPRVFTPALLMTDWDHKTSRYVDQVMGAFMFMQTSIFEKIGFFDEQFFVYYEELDFSRRLFANGGKSYFSSNIKAIHSGGGTTKNVKATRLFLNLQSRLLYAKKHFSGGGYNFVKFCTFFIEPITRNVLLMLRGNFKEVKNVFQAYILLIKNKA